MMTGRTLAHFEVLEKLGQGGMGVVYKARDAQLNRFVALKVLPPDKVTDLERRLRFMQEARAASALNHPNIVTIHEISNAEGVDFIAMEYVAGRTLDQLIPRTGLKLTEALRIAVQVADGLTCAHAAGIVHRDLKPSNIMVGQSSVKLLDFGLAKLTEPATQGPDDDATMTEARIAQVPRTDEGVVMGTVAYMSPEQAQGKPVDARTDIFAFGAVLYEMVSGRRAFSCASKQATLAAVMRDEPALLAHVPHELEKLIARCLRKDPVRRAQHMADLKLELEQMKEESESGFSASGNAAPKAFPRRWGWMIAALAAVVVLGASGAFWNVRHQPDRIPPEMQPVVLTSYTGLQRFPALSPDGKQVAFSWDGERGDNFDIYIKLVDAGAPLRLTQAPEDDILPAWSPDGRFLAFVRLSKQGKGGYYVVPALSGAERKVADIPQTPSHRPYPSLDWTPDSKSLVIVDTAVNPPALAEVLIAEGDKKDLTTPPANSLGDYMPAVSPDGKWLAFARVPATGVQNWQVVPFAHAISSRPVPLPITGAIAIMAGASDARSFPRVSWASDSAHVIAVETASSGSRLVRVSAPGSERPEPILSAGTAASEPSIAREKGRLAYVHSFRNTSLWRADLRNPSAAPTRVIASTRVELQPDYSADGSHVVFVSDRSGNREVWSAGADGASPLQITAHAATPTAPRWSPDGRQIVFAQRPGGNVDIYVVDAQGGTPRRLTTDPANDASAYWSRDGKWIYFASNRTGRFEVWKLPADGSAREVQVTRNGGWRSRESLDGKMLYFQKFDEVGLFGMPAEGGTEERIAEVQPPQDWQLALDAIYYFQPVGENYTVRRVDLRSGKTTEALSLPPGTTGNTANFTVSPDSRWLIFVHADQIVTELMMIDNFR